MNLNAVASTAKLPLMGSAGGPFADIFSNTVLWGGYHIRNVEAFPEENFTSSVHLPTVSGKVQWRNFMVCTKVNI